MNQVVRQEAKSAVVHADPQTIMEVISRAANDPSTDVEKFERLMGLYERIDARNSENAFNAAMSETQADMRPIAADCSNPQTRSRYASYLALDRAMRPIYSRHGFSLSFDTGEGAPADHVRVVCFVTNAGHTRKYHVDMPSDGKGAKGNDVMTKTHAVGSAMTYGQRYLLKLIFNITVGEDNDGNRSNPTGEVISQDQADKIRDLIEETGTKVDAFCNHFHIAAVPDLPAFKYNAAVSALNKKRSAAQ